MFTKRVLVGNGNGSQRSVGQGISRWFSSDKSNSSGKFSLLKRILCRDSVCQKNSGSKWRTLDLVCLCVELDSAVGQRAHGVDA